MLLQLLHPLLSIPRTRTDTARCAFFVAEPSVRNSLRDNIRLCTPTDTFKRHLKTLTYLTSLSLAPPSASVSSDFMEIYKYCIIIIIIIYFFYPR